MPEEPDSPEIQPAQPMPPQHSGEVYDDLQFEQKRLSDRLLNWAAGLPWWAIILAVVAIAVIYSMFTSAAYQNVLRALTREQERHRWPAVPGNSRQSTRCLQRLCGFGRVPDDHDAPVAESLPAHLQSEGHVRQVRLRMRQQVAAQPLAGGFEC